MLGQTGPAGQLRGGRGQQSPAGTPANTGLGGLECGVWSQRERETETETEHNIKRNNYLTSLHPQYHHTTPPRYNTDTGNDWTLEMAWPDSLLSSPPLSAMSVNIRILTSDYSHNWSSMFDVRTADWGPEYFLAVRIISYYSF